MTLGSWTGCVTGPSREALVLLTLPGCREQKQPGLQLQCGQLGVVQEPSPSQGAWRERKLLRLICSNLFFVEAQQLLTALVKASEGTARDRENR